MIKHVLRHVLKTINMLDRKEIAGKTKELMR